MGQINTRLDAVADIYRHGIKLGVLIRLMMGWQP